MQPDQPAPVVPIADELSAVERLAVRLHEHYRPLAGDVLIFEDCLEIARFAVGALRREVDAAYQRGLAEGRTQATEGWERQWAFQGDGHVRATWSEESARYLAEYGHDRVVVSRLVGPWEPAEQTEAPPGAMQVLNPRTGAWELAFDGVLAPEEPATGGVVKPSGPLTTEDGCTLTVPIRPRPRMTDGCGPEHTYRGTCAYANEEADRG